MDQYKSFDAFVRVARLGSFTAAAAEMGITTSTVSKLISELESRVETRLLYRSTRQLSLTSEGRDFHQKLSAAMGEIGQAVEALKASRTEPAGKVRLWSTAAIGKDHVVPLLPAFLEAHPKVDVEMRFDDHVPDLVADGYDLAIQHRGIADGAQILRRLCALPLLTVASPDCLARHGQPDHPSAFAELPCVVTSNATDGVGAWDFTRRDDPSVQESVQPNGRVSLLEQYEGVIQAALAGLGFTVAYAHSALPYLRSGDLCIALLDWDPVTAGLESNAVFLRYPIRRYEPLQVRALIDHIVDHFNDPAVMQLDLSPWLGRVQP